MTTARLARAALIVSLLLVVAGVAVEAQRRGGRFFAPIRMAQPEHFDGAFNFCRLAFARSYDGDGGGWNVDYPRADINMSIRLSELTKTRISRDGAGEPSHVVLQPSDPLLFKCPFVMMTEVGAAHLGPEDAAQLRDYLLKGGFLWADDFWGEYAWQAWAREFAKVLPPGEYPWVTLPLDHPIFRSQFVVRRMPQIPSINFWYGSGGGTSERYDSQVPTARAILDAHGNIMALATHNTDIGDSWEQEAADPNYFYMFSVDGYAFGINVLLYAMTH
jgi:hypothetical protein